MTQKTGLQKTGEVRSLILNNNFKQQLSEVLPKHLTPDRMARVAIASLTRTPKLAECTTESVFKCMMELSSLGLEPDGRKAHLIPYRDNKKGITECTVIIDYKGYVALLYRTGLVSNIHADKICKKDIFVYNMGTVEKHIIDFSEQRGESYAYYCVVTMKDGSKKSEVMSTHEVDIIRNGSISKNSPAWRDHYDEMAKKVVFKRLRKWLSLDVPEISDVVDKAIKLDNEEYKTIDVKSSAPENLDDVARDLTAKLEAKNEQ